MNYYIQGNKEKADQIKAEFENKGMSDLSGYNFGNKHALFYTYDCEGSKVLATVCANLHVAEIIKTHPDYQELELPVKPHYDISNFNPFDKVLVRDGDRGTQRQPSALQRGHRAVEREDYRLGAWWKTASELANIYAADGQPALIQYAADDMNLIIDEFGREPIPASNYGTKMNVLQFLLQLRYDKRRTTVTHITTNLTPDRLEPLYGDYVADRCKEMFNFIEFNGESLR